MLTRREVLRGLGAASLSCVLSPARACESGPSPHAGPRVGYFPNAVLRTHEGEPVRFYDDLIRGKTVAINMMYATCEGICPRSTGNLLEVQDALGERLGRDVFMYSITLQPEKDSPEVLKEYVEMHGVKPGWLFLTGAKRDIETIRYRLGFYDSDPEVDGDKSAHTGMVRIGNEALDRWAMAPALGPVDQIVKTIEWLGGARPT